MFSSVIFFDLDNTLIEGPFGTAVFPIVLDELARKTKCDQKEIRRLIVKENLDRQNDPFCSAVKAMDWDDIFAAIANRFGVALDANAEEIVKAQAKEHSRLLDGARETLIALQHPSRALIVATKGLIKYQRPVLEALGITHFFTDILTPNSHNALKQDRAFYGEWLSQTPEILKTSESSDFNRKRYKHSERSGEIFSPRSRGGGESLRLPHPSTTRREARRSAQDAYRQSRGSQTSEVLMPTRIMVGDHYVDDVVPPNQFGMITVWKNDEIKDQLLMIEPLERPRYFQYTDDQPVKPTAIIKSLYELPDVIAQLSAQHLTGLAEFNVC